MGDLLVPIKVRKSTKDFLENDVKQEFLRNHPEYKDIRLSMGTLIKKISQYYVEA